MATQDGGYRALRLPLALQNAQVSNSPPAADKTNWMLSLSCQVYDVKSIKQIPVTQAFCATIALMRSSGENGYMTDRLNTLADSYLDHIRIAVKAMAIMAHARSAPDEYRLKYAARDKAAKLIVDHAVPVAVMVNMFFQPRADLTRDGLRALLIKWHHLGLLTHEENARLNAAGLNSKMPSDWDYMDVFARYRSVGIEAS
ncbi:hypothetical protein [Komagataeibacter saccharivorans]|uniref:hypothetical protein n=1 Tax=Komagataeibacter saccharivorans TaxID=265959 RepID=UPI001052665B|nr:hypothetical protein [Komagataeibacter saccharivorans]